MDNSVVKNQPIRDTLFTRKHDDSKYNQKGFSKHSNSQKVKNKDLKAITPSLPSGNVVSKRCGWAKHVQQPMIWEHVFVPRPVFDALTLRDLEKMLELYQVN